ncbi:MAG: hypothetical protein JXR13_02480 [Thalassovita sp.]
MRAAAGLRGRLRAWAGARFAGAGAAALGGVTEALAGGAALGVGAETAVGAALGLAFGAATGASAAGAGLTLGTGALGAGVLGAGSNFSEISRYLPSIWAVWKGDVDILVIACASRNWVSNE